MTTKERLATRRVTAAIGLGRRPRRHLKCTAIVRSIGVVALALSGLALVAPAARAVAAGSPIGNFDTAVPTVAGPTHVTGWAADPDGPGHHAAVAIYAEGQLVGYTPSAAVERPDVGAAFPGYGSDHGFDFTFTLAPGAHNVCAAAINTSGTSGSDVILGCRTITIGSPVGSLDSIGPGMGHTIVGGWAIDSDTADSVAVAAFADGNLVAYQAATVDRPDINAAFPGYGPAHGFELSFDLSHSANLCVVAYNVQGTPGTAVLIGCRTYDPSPVGNFESYQLTPQGVRLTGWALDLDAPAESIRVYVSDNNNVLGNLISNADGPRSDIDAAFPGAGPNHGIDVTVPISDAAGGVHSYCLLAENVAGTNGPPLVQIGCRQFIDTPTVGNLEVLGRSTPTTVRVRGWVLDTRPLGSTTSGSYAVVIDGEVVWADDAILDRPDIAAAFPGFGPAHGFDDTETISTAPHQVCVLAADRDVTESRIILLRCATV